MHMSWKLMCTFRLKYEHLSDFITGTAIQTETEIETKTGKARERHKDSDRGTVAGAITVLLMNFGHAGRAEYNSHAIKQLI